MGCDILYQRGMCYSNAFFFCEFNLEHTNVMKYGLQRGKTISKQRNLLFLRQNALDIIVFETVMSKG
jgi:hypothetical protein